VLAIKAVQTRLEASKATPEQCDVVEKLCICKGAKVMLMQNIWIKQGLVNRTTGLIEDIMWCADADVKKDSSQALLISADKYTGPALYHTANSKPVIPIFPVYCEWEGSKGSCSCKQFSVALAFTLTIHKSQGLILDCAVLDISMKDRTSGLAYISISQIKKLTGLLFEKGFDQDHFNPSDSSVKQVRLRDIEQQRGQLLS
jgi:ATP-dependent exoDNAse (exonuclease V) alpha subunit